MKKKLVTEDFSGVAIMLTITIFATIVSDMLPVSNNTPLIGSVKPLTKGFQHLCSFSFFKSKFHN